MLRNHITIALRNIRRNLSYAVINISGLALGITCSIVLFLMITFHTSFDNYHPDSDRIYRIVSSSLQNGREGHFAGVPPPLPDALRSEITGIESLLFISHVKGGLITIGDDNNRKIFEDENGVAYTDSVFFNFFTRKLLSGSVALSKPNEAVLSQRIAKKYFGDTDPLGKVILYNNATNFIVTGVLDDYPDNTNFPFDILFSFETIREQKIKEGWHSVYSGDQCFVKLVPGKPASEINDQFPAFIEKYRDPEGETQMKSWLQPLNKLHHDGRFNNYRFRTAPAESLWALGIVAMFLIITACINFINLTTAVAVKRSKEVGVRKVLGSQRLQLAIQYLVETGTITLVAIGLSVGLAEMALIWLNGFMELDLHIHLFDPALIIFLAATWLVVSTISGLYPALVLSGFSPVSALKNKITNKNSSGYMLRRVLVVSQFVISQFMIVSTIIMLSQIDYSNSYDLGFTKEAVLTVPIPEPANLSKKTTLKTEIGRLTGVDDVSLCYTPPSSGTVSVADFKITGVEGSHFTQVKMADHRYIDLFDIELVAGRRYGESDTATGFIVNEQLVKETGLTPEEILGRNMTLWGKTAPIVAVVNDFHTMSLENEIAATTIFSDLKGYRNLSVKVEPGDVSITLREIEKVWSTQYPDFLFSYEFLDEYIANLYENGRRMSVLLIIFSSMAVFIGCMGLYGLISFMAMQKEKEIGVRKVLGASVQQILFIFSRELILLIVIAFLLASPLAGYIMSQLLQDIPYHVSLSWFMFLTGIGITMVIAFATVGYRSLRSAHTNPVDVLRSE